MSDKKSLKPLYTSLIDNHIHEVKGWHDSYIKFQDEISDLRESLIKKPKQALEHPFLERLIYQLNNGIADKGMSFLSWEDFSKITSKSEFTEVLKAFIQDPSLENYHKLETAYNAAKGSKNPVIINRIAAACNKNLCSTVDHGKFNQVFSWLENNGHIDKYPGPDYYWYSKNEYLMGQIHEQFQEDLDTGKTDEVYLSIFVWELYANIANPFSLKKQIVKYGAPGTGKTYTAKEETELCFDIWKADFRPDDDSYSYEQYMELVQFHPSYSYEDFIEGLRPVLNEDGTTKLTLQNGVFKDFCMRAGRWECDVYRMDLELDWDNITVGELKQYKYKDKLRDEYWASIFKLPEETKVADAVPHYFFIIDEINRAELSRVFGELMYCLEYRGTKGAIKTQYSNLNTDETGMLKVGNDQDFKKNSYQFFIPNNVYLIGTMNTIDRSVDSFDFALRRRFRWEKVKPDMSVLRHYLHEFNSAWAGLSDNLKNLNEKIHKHHLLGEDYEIGHAYLMNLKYSKDLGISEVRGLIWKDSIRPLLEEYLRGTGKEGDVIKELKEAFGV